MFKSSNRFEVSFIIILILFGFLFHFFLFPRKAYSEILSTSVQVQIVTTTTTTIGGGGGGGGYIPPLPPETKVIFEGRAYPLSKVNVLKDGQLAVSTISGPDAKFYASIEGLSSGNYLFAVYSEDSHGRRSTLFTFPVFITQGVTTKISGIFIAPTIDINKSEVKRGENIAIFGQSVPQSDIVISVSSDEEFFTKTISDKDGIYLYNFDTSVLDYGSHYTKSKASIENLISGFSYSINFQVGTKTIMKKTIKVPEKGDLNNDKRVNLIDFSVLAYWYNRLLPSSTVDFNNDGKVNLVDFSIMAYYWTG